MAPRVRKGKTKQRPAARVAGPLEAFGRRRIFAGTLLSVVLLAALAVNSFPSGAVTVTGPAASRPAVTTTVLTAPALIHVPAADRLVRVDAVLTGPARPTRGTHRSRRVTASRARVSIGSRQARLSFTLGAGKRNAKLKTLTVRLPRGMAFSRSTERLAAGIVVQAGGEQLKLTEAFSHSKLTITLLIPASSVRVTIESPAITISRALAHRVRTREIKALYTRIAATNTNDRTTRLTLKPRTS